MGVRRPIAGTKYPAEQKKKRQECGSRAEELISGERAEEWTMSWPASRVGVESRVPAG
jgi:hypothetical protein